MHINGFYRPQRSTVIGTRRWCCLGGSGSAEAALSSPTQPTNPGDGLSSPPPWPGASRRMRTHRPVDAWDRGWRCMRQQSNVDADNEPKCAKTELLLIGASAAVKSTTRCNRSCRRRRRQPRQLPTSSPLFWCWWLCAHPGRGRRREHHREHRRGASWRRQDSSAVSALLPRLGA